LYCGAFSSVASELRGFDVFAPAEKLSSLAAQKLFHDSHNSCAAARRALASFTPFSALAVASLAFAYFVRASFSFFSADFISDRALLWRASIVPPTGDATNLAQFPKLEQQARRPPADRNRTDILCRRRYARTSQCCGRAWHARKYNFGKSFDRLSFRALLPPGCDISFLLRSGLGRFLGQRIISAIKTLTDRTYRIASAVIGTRLASGRIFSHVFSLLSRAAVERWRVNRWSSNGIVWNSDQVRSASGVVQAYSDHTPDQVFMFCRGFSCRLSSSAALFSR